MSNTRRPAAASAVARLMAVVVLPTPPFWLASATIRARRTTGTARGWASTVARLTGDLLQAKNDPPPIGQALFDRRAHCPAFAHPGQFLLKSLALGEQAQGLGREKGRRQFEQPIQRRAGARGHNIDRVRRHSLDAARTKHHLRLRDPCSLSQEGTPPGICL